MGKVGKHKSGVKGMQKTNNAMEQGFGNMTIYDSDDEDDDNGIIMQPSKRSGGRKELNSLANVDLTFPLRPEEFIPEQRHRVVPERPTEIATTKNTMEPASTKSKKKKKKESKQKKKEMKQRTIEAPSNDVDLLDIFGTVQEVNTSQQITSHAPTSNSSSIAMNLPTSAVNNAFDDLFGISNPVPQISTNNFQTSSLTEQDGVVTYLRGTI